MTESNTLDMFFANTMEDTGPAAPSTVQEAPMISEEKSELVLELEQLEVSIKKVKTVGVINPHGSDYLGKDHPLSLARLENLEIRFCKLEGTITDEDYNQRYKENFKRIQEETEKLVAAVRE